MVGERGSTAGGRSGSRGEALYGTKRVVAAVVRRGGDGMGRGHCRTRDEALLLRAEKVVVAGVGTGCWIEEVGPRRREIGTREYIL